jgi:hypothetical protein
MCWDVTICRCPPGIKSLEQLANNFKPAAIASRAEVAQSFKLLFPDADVSDLSWLVLDGHEFKIEIDTGHMDPCNGLMLHVRGSNEAVGAVTQIALNFKSRAFDMTAYQFHDLMSNPTSGFDQWHKSSHRVVGAAQPLILDKLAFQCDKFQ